MNPPQISPQDNRSDHAGESRSQPSYRRAAFSLSLLVAFLVGAVGAHATDNVTVSNTTYTNGQTPTVQADNTITAGPAVVVNNGANVTYIAGGHISLGTGFQVDAGGVFHLSVGESLPYAASFESS